MLSGELEADRDAPGDLAHSVGDRPIVRGSVQIGKGRRADRGVSGLEAADFGDLALDLFTGQVTARAGLGALAALEVERLGARDLL